jgi:predicted nucleic acid-binding protein
VWIPSAVVSELQAGQLKECGVPNPNDYGWIRVVEPRSLPSEWFAVDLGVGEIAAISLAMDYPEAIILLDDALARRTAKAAGLHVWGTLRILLETKANGLIDNVKSPLNRVSEAGMRISEEIAQRVLVLAGEK